MFQEKGKDHINHIHRVANDVMARNNFSIPIEVCIREALRLHREEMIEIDNNMRKADPYYERNRIQYKDTVKIPVPPRIGIPVRGIPAPIQMSALND